MVVVCLVCLVNAVFHASFFYAHSAMMNCSGTFLFRFGINDESLDSNDFKIVEVQLLCTTDSPPLILVRFTSSVCAPFELHMHKKFEVNRTTEN